jgi:hypothetical protein
VRAAATPLAAPVSSLVHFAIELSEQLPQAPAGDRNEHGKQDDVAGRHHVRSISPRASIRSGGVARQSFASKNIPAHEEAKAPARRESAGPRFRKPLGFSLAFPGRNLDQRPTARKTTQIMMMRKPSQIVSMTSCLSRSGVNQFLPRLAMLNAEVRQGVRVVSHGDGQDLAPRQDACYTRWPGHCLAPNGTPATPVDAFVGGRVIAPTLAKMRQSQDARRPINPGLARSVPGLNFAP